MRFTRKRVTLFLAAPLMGAALMLSTASACSNGTNSGQAAEGSAQGADNTLQNQNQPVPVFPTSAYRMELIEVEAIEALGSPTTTFFFPPATTVVETNNGPTFSAPPIKVCPSQGEPVAANASLTNPLVPYQGSVNTGADKPVVGQADPIGAYLSPSTTGTNVLCDGANGQTRLDYWEGDVFSESGTAVWSSTNGIVDVGTDVLPTCVVMTAYEGDGSDVNPGDKYYHCTDPSSGHSVNSSPIGGSSSTPSGNPTQSSQALAS